MRSKAKESLLTGGVGLDWPSPIETPLLFAIADKRSHQQEMSLLWGEKAPRGVPWAIVSYGGMSPGHLVSQKGFTPSEATIKLREYLKAIRLGTPLEPSLIKIELPAPKHPLPEGVGEPMILKRRKVGEWSDEETKEKEKEWAEERAAALGQKSSAEAEVDVAAIDHNMMLRAEDGKEVAYKEAVKRAEYDTSQRDKRREKREAKMLKELGKIDAEAALTLANKLRKDREGILENENKEKADAKKAAEDQDMEPFRGPEEGVPKEYRLRETGEGIDPRNGRNGREEENEKEEKGNGLEKGEKGSHAEARVGKAFGAIGIMKKTKKTKRQQDTNKGSIGGVGGLMNDDNNNNNNNNNNIEASPSRHADVPMEEIPQTPSAGEPSASHHGHADL